MESPFILKNVPHFWRLGHSETHFGAVRAEPLELFHKLAIETIKCNARASL